MLLLLRFRFDYIENCVRVMRRRGGRVGSRHILALACAWFDAHGWAAARQNKQISSPKPCFTPVAVVVGKAGHGATCSSSLLSGGLLGSTHPSVSSVTQWVSQAWPAAHIEANLHTALGARASVRARVMMDEPKPLSVLAGLAKSKVKNFNYINICVFT